MIVQIDMHSKSASPTTEKSLQKFSFFPIPAYEKPIIDNYPKNYLSIAETQIIS